MDREALVEDIKRLANDVLPALSVHHELPVSNNHCFLRIAYDNAVYQKWDQVVTAPFLNHATLEQLSAANAILQRLHAEPQASYAFNNFSLRCRGQGYCSEWLSC